MFPDHWLKILGKKYNEAVIISTPCCSNISPNYNLDVISWFSNIQPRTQEVHQTNHLLFSGDREAFTGATGAPGAFTMVITP